MEHGFFHWLIKTNAMLENWISLKVNSLIFSASEFALPTIKLTLYVHEVSGLKIFKVVSKKEKTKKKPCYCWRPFFYVWRKLEMKKNTPKCHSIPTTYSDTILFLLPPYTPSTIKKNINNEADYYHLRFVECVLKCKRKSQKGRNIPVNISIK